MNEQLRAQSRARLAETETRLLEIQSHLAASRERQALEVICDVRSQMDALFVTLLVGHLRETLGEDATPEITQSQMQESKLLLDQLLN